MIMPSAPRRLALVIPYKNGLRRTAIGRLQTNRRISSSPPAKRRAPRVAGEKCLNESISQVRPNQE